jgi:hypothetical protein
MYDTCAFGGCTVTFDQCHVHHVDFVEHGGHTNIDRLVPLCSRHHHLVHDLHWKLHLAPDRTITVIRPDGQLHHQIPYQPIIVSATGPPARAPATVGGRSCRQSCPDER